MSTWSLLLNRATPYGPGTKHLSPAHSYISAVRSRFRPRLGTQRGKRIQGRLGLDLMAPQLPSFITGKSVHSKMKRYRLELFLMDFKVQYDTNVVMKMATCLGRTDMQDRKKMGG